MLTEEQFDERDKIVELFVDKTYCDGWIGGVKHFKGMPVDILKKLVKKGYADPEEYQNSAPTTAEFIEFCEKHLEFRLHGYIVKRERPDTRISIEGIDTQNLNTDIEDLLMFRFADDFVLDTTEKTFHCWYD